MKKVLKKILAASLALAISAATLVQAPFNTKEVKAASAVTVDVASKQQKISGFGASSAWCGALSDSVMNYLYTDCGFSIVRLRIAENNYWSSGNYNAWADELSNAKKAIARGAIVFASPWNPPASMLDKITKNGKTCSHLRTDKYAEYAKYLNTFGTYMKNNGVNLFAISIQNEPDYGYDWTWWEPSEVLNFTKNYASQIGYPVMSAESFCYNKNYYNSILNDSAACNNIAVFGTHFYGTAEKDIPYSLMKQKGKEIWMTEHYFDDAGISGAMSTAKDIHLSMVNGNMNAYVYWWINAGNGLLKDNKYPIAKAYVIGQYSKFVRKGYYRVSADATPQSNVYVSAYTGDNKVVVVAINQGTSAVNQTFQINNAAVSSVSRYTTSSSQNLQKGSDISVSNGSFTASLPAQSVTTYVGTINGTTPVSPSPSPSTSVTPSKVLKDGWYYIKNVNAQKYLQVKDNTGANAQNVEIGTGSGVAGQKWYLTNNADGTVTFTSALGNYALDVANGSDTDGANIQIYTQWNGTSQKFTIQTTGTEGVYTIATASSNQSKNLDVYNFGKDDGTNVCQWTYGGFPNQQWIFESISTAPAVSTTPSPSASSSPSPSSTATASQTPASGISYEYSVVSDWGTSFQGQLVITNNSSKTYNGWTLTCNYNSTITSLWGAELVSQSGSKVTIQNPSWDASFAPGASVTVNFIATLGSDKNAPTGYTFG